MEIKEIIFFVESKFSLRDYKRFGIKILINNGFNVSVWDLTGALHNINEKGNSDFQNKTGFDLIKFRFISEIIDQMQSIDSKTLIINFVSYNIKTIPIYNLIRNNKLNYCFRSDASPSVTDKKSLKTYLDKFRRLKMNKIINFFYYLFINQHSKYFMPSARFVLLGGQKSFPIKKNNCGKVGLETIPIWAHALDYDYYLEHDKISEFNNLKYVVFIDNYMPFHEDPKRIGKKPRENPDMYYPELCTLFNMINVKQGYEVIIAAHPRSSYDELPDYFNGREVIKGKTHDLIKNSQFVIMHVSASITFPVLYKKPIIFITTDRLNKTKFNHTISTYAKLFEKMPINISKEIDKLNLISELNLDSNKYLKYKNDYIKKSESADLPYWQIVSNKLLNL